MNESDPVIGDVVTLKSGGPDMTILMLQSPDDPNKLFCGWFNREQEFRTASFHPDTLDWD